MAMVKILALILIVVFFAACVWVGDAAASVNDTIIDRVGDWFAVFGKSEDEKEMMLARRRAARVAERMQKEAENSMKDFDRKMKEALGR